MAKVIVGGSDCQIFADLDPVPEVGDTITLRKEDVTATMGFGGELIGKTLLITTRKEIVIGEDPTSFLGVEVEIA